MQIRLGYVAIALGLDKVTSSSTVTYRYYKGLTSEAKINKLKQVTLSNIQDLEKILRYNVDNDVHFYRLTSALVPLATHQDVEDWPYRKLFKMDFDYIGKLIKKHHMRVDLHADQFNVINSVRKEVVKNTMTNLLFLAHILEDIHYPEGKIIIHVGSSQGGKQEAIKRFIDNFQHFPEVIREKIIIENDDKTFDVQDVLELCHRLNIPMVLDAHHYLCNNRGENLFDYIDDIFGTWNKDIFIPKIHYSSPKESPLDRRHADYIMANEFVDFIMKINSITERDFDIMLEAKKKELALFQLMEDIQAMDLEWHYPDKTTIDIRS